MEEEEQQLPPSPVLALSRQSYCQQIDPIFPTINIVTRLGNPLSFWQGVISGVPGSWWQRLGHLMDLIFLAAQEAPEPEEYVTDADELADKIEEFAAQEYPGEPVWS